MKASTWNRNKRKILLKDDASDYYDDCKYPQFWFFRKDIKDKGSNRDENDKKRWSNYDHHAQGQGWQEENKNPEYLLRIEKTEERPDGILIEGSPEIHLKLTIYRIF